MTTEPHFAISLSPSYAITIASGSSSSPSALIVLRLIVLRLIVLRAQDFDYLPPALRNSKGPAAPVPHARIDRLDLHARAAARGHRLIERAAQSAWRLARDAALDLE
jgi:hypothetical protein